MDPKDIPDPQDELARELLYRLRPDKYMSEEDRQRGARYSWSIAIGFIVFMAAALVFSFIWALSEMGMKR